MCYTSRHGTTRHVTSRHGTVHRVPPDAAGLRALHLSIKPLMTTTHEVHPQRNRVAAYHRGYCCSKTRYWRCLPAAQAASNQFGHISTVVSLFRVVRTQNLTFTNTVALKIRNILYILCLMPSPSLCTTRRCQYTPSSSTDAPFITIKTFSRNTQQ